MRSLLFFLSAPVICSAQDEDVMFPENAKEKKVKSVTCYHMSDGKKVTRERTSFDDSGRVIGRAIRNYHNDTVGYFLDTTFYYQDRTVQVSNSMYRDSTVIRKVDGINGSKTLLKEYDNGKLHSVKTIEGDSLRNSVVEEIYRSDTVFRRNVTWHIYTRDSAGRIVRYIKIDSTYFKNLSEELVSRSYDIVYKDNVVIQTYYRGENGTQITLHRHYKFADRMMDSAVSYDEKGKVRSMSIHRYDSLNRGVEWIDMDHRKKTDFRVVSIYHPDSTVHTNYDAKGRLQTTSVETYNSKGLTIHYSINGSEGPFDLWYDYTYYD
jgi:hypothetical protein